MEGKYYTLTIFHNDKKSCCLAFKTKSHCEEQMHKEYYREVDSKRFDQILSVKQTFEELEEHIGKRGRKPIPKWIGFTSKSKGNFTMKVVIGEEIGDIEYLEKINRFSD